VPSLCFILVAFLGLGLIFCNRKPARRAESGKRHRCKIKRWR
jgi:hypothetical protein